MPEWLEVWCIIRLYECFADQNSIKSL